MNNCFVELNPVFFLIASYFLLRIWEFPGFGIIKR